MSEQSGRKWQDYSVIRDEVIKVLDKHPEGMTGARIAELIGITQGAMSKYLSMMNVDGIIASRRVGVAKLWRLVSQSDRAGLLADRMGEAEATFKDYATSLVEEDSRLIGPDGRRVIVMSTTMLSSLYRYTKSMLGTEVGPFFYEWGRDYVRELSPLVDDLAAKTGAGFIESFLLLWRLKGWGTFKVVQMGQSEIEVEWHDSLWAEDLKEGAPVDDFVAGALAEAASHATGQKWRFIEASCKATGAPQCAFKGAVVP
jgi:predicted hydrocarbon binding protein